MKGREIIKYILIVACGLAIGFGVGYLVKVGL